MSSRVEIPFPPRTHAVIGPRVEPPSVPFEPRWEYKEVTRNLETELLPTEAELNALGTEHWELAGVVHQGEWVHFYFKRDRAG